MKNSHKKFSAVPDRFDQSLCRSASTALSIDSRNVKSNHFINIAPKSSVASIGTRTNKSEDGSFGRNSGTVGSELGQRGNHSLDRKVLSSAQPNRRQHSGGTKVSIVNDIGADLLNASSGEDLCFPGGKYLEDGTEFDSSLQHPWNADAASAKGCHAPNKPNSRGNIYSDLVDSPYKMLIHTPSPVVLPPVESKPTAIVTDSGFIDIAQLGKRRQSRFVQLDSQPIRVMNIEPPLAIVRSLSRSTSSRLGDSMMVSRTVSRSPSHRPRTQSQSQSQRSPQQEPTSRTVNGSRFFEEKADSFIKAANIASRSTAARPSSHASPLPNFDARGSVTSLASSATAGTASVPPKARGAFRGGFLRANASIAKQAAEVLEEDRAVRRALAAKDKNRLAEAQKAVESWLKREQSGLTIGFPGPAGPDADLLVSEGLVKDELCADEALPRGASETGKLSTEPDSTASSDSPRGLHHLSPQSRSKSAIKITDKDATQTMEPRALDKRSVSSASSSSNIISLKIVSSVVAPPRSSSPSVPVVPVVPVVPAARGGGSTRERADLLTGANILYRVGADDRSLQSAMADSLHSDAAGAVAVGGAGQENANGTLSAEASVISKASNKSKTSTSPSRNIGGGSKISFVLSSSHFPVENIESGRDGSRTSVLLADSLAESPDAVAKMVDDVMTGEQEREREREQASVDGPSCASHSASIQSISIGGSRLRRAGKGDGEGDLRKPFLGEVPAAVAYMDPAEPAPFQVHKRIMGWKLTSLQRRRELISLLDAVHHSHDGSFPSPEALRRTARRSQQQLPPMPMFVPFSGRDALASGIVDPASLRPSLHLSSTLPVSSESARKRQSAAWERTINRMVTSRQSYKDPQSIRCLMQDKMRRKQEAREREKQEKREREERQSRLGRSASDGSVEYPIARSPSLCPSPPPSLSRQRRGPEYELEHEQEQWDSHAFSPFYDNEPVEHARFGGHATVPQTRMRTKDRMEILDFLVPLAAEELRSFVDQKYRGVKPKPRSRSRRRGRGPYVSSSTQLLSPLDIELGPLAGDGEDATASLLRSLFGEDEDGGEALDVSYLGGRDRSSGSGSGLGEFGAIIGDLENASASSAGTLEKDDISSIGEESSTYINTFFQDLQRLEAGEALQPEETAEEPPGRQQRREEEVGDTEAYGERERRRDDDQQTASPIVESSEQEQETEAATAAGADQDRDQGLEFGGNPEDGKEGGEEGRREKEEEQDERREQLVGIALGSPQFTDEVTDTFVSAAHSSGPVDELGERQSASSGCPAEEGAGEREGGRRGGAATQKPRELSDSVTAEDASAHSLSHSLSGGEDDQLREGQEE